MGYNGWRDVREGGRILRYVGWWSSRVGVVDSGNSRGGRRKSVGGLRGVAWEVAGFLEFIRGK